MYGTRTYRFIDQNQPNQPNVGKYIPSIDPYRSCGLRRVSFCCCCTSTWSLWTKTSLHPKKLPGTLPPEVGCFVLGIFVEGSFLPHIFWRGVWMSRVWRVICEHSIEVQVRHLQLFFSVKFCLALLLVQAISKAKHSVQNWFSYMFIYPKHACFVVLGLYPWTSSHTCSGYVLGVYIGKWMCWCWCCWCSYGCHGHVEIWNAQIAEWQWNDAYDDGCKQFEILFGVLWN